jgi:integrase
MPNLTDKLIAGATIPPGKREAWLSDSDVKGLRLRITPGAKTFFAAWTDRATGERRREKLGAWGSLTVAQARAAARIVLGKVAAGADPAAEREARRAAAAQRKAEAARQEADARFTLAELIEEWSRHHLARKRPSYAREAARALRVAFAADLQGPASALDRARVRAVIKAMDADGHAPMAARTLAYGRAAYAWAMAEERLTASPFAGIATPVGGAPERDRVLTAEEVGAIWRAAGSLGFPFGPVVRLLLLTAQRRAEVAGLRWSEIAADGSAWTLPAARAKNGKVHVVHLSEAAREVLASLPRIAGQDLVFTTNGRTAPSGFGRAKAALDAAIAKAEGQPIAPWRLHDFRRSAVTMLAGAGIAPHVADKLLNHAQGSIKGVAAIYQRAEFLPERARALDAWGAHVVAMGEGREPAEAGRVVRLRAGGAQN